MNQRNVIIIGVVLYLLSGIGSYAYFAKNSVDTSQYTTPVTNANGEVVDNNPKTEECPINGQKYSKVQKTKWEGRRPLAIAIENSLDSRPQSGLGSADVVYEAVAEGGITRFLAVFYCEDAKIAGPVRSARIYFVKLVQGYGAYPLYGHVGGANTPGPADALGEIRDLGWAGYNDMNQFNVPFPNYWRDYDRLPGVVTEHTMYTDTSKLWKYAKEDRKLSNVDSKGNKWDEDFEPWTFQDDAKADKRGTKAKISFGFWDASVSNYGVEWNYDTTTNSYKRVNGGKPHLDKNTDKQLEAKNVIIAFAEESPANDGYEGGHLLYDVVGGDDAIIFQNGQAIKGTWTKKTEENSMMFFDADGDEVKMVRGPVWVEVVPAGNKITY